MRNVKYQHLKHLTMSNFKKEAKKYIINKRGLKDNDIKMHDTISSSFIDNHKYVNEFMKYFTCIATHVSKKNKVDPKRIKHMFKKMFVHENKALFEGKDVQGRLKKLKIVKDEEYDSTNTDEADSTFEEKLFRALK
jgi:hypothetical protein